jgi:hypothetical protein
MELKSALGHHRSGCGRQSVLITLRNLRKEKQADFLQHSELGVGCVSCVPGHGRTLFGSKHLAGR